MNKKGGAISWILLILLLIAAMIISALWANYQHDELCRERGYEKTIGWNTKPLHQIFVNFGQPERAYVDCVKGDEYKKFYLDEVEE